MRKLSGGGREQFVGNKGLGPTDRMRGRSRRYFSALRPRFRKNGRKNRNPGPFFCRMPVAFVLRKVPHAGIFNIFALFG